MSVLQLLRTCSWQELCHHPWRHGAAVLAVMLGVALAFSVHLINASALSEFAQAARTVGGQSDLEVRAPQSWPPTPSSTGKKSICACWAWTRCGWCTPHRR
jgi:putative ABC transport system permease protein